jgi:hypothetical protein
MKERIPRETSKNIFICKNFKTQFFINKRIEKQKVKLKCGHFLGPGMAYCSNVPLWQKKF